VIYRIGNAYLRVFTVLVVVLWVLFYTLCAVYASDYTRSDWGTFRKATRPTVLQRASVGMVIDAYTGWPIPAEACQLDHIVPVAVAFRLGGHSWPYALRSEFYNDTDNLVCTTGGMNASKGDRAPREWLPKDSGWYLARWRKVCGKYGLHCEKVMP